MVSPDLVCIGGAHVDLVARAHAPLLPGTSNPGSIESRIGGVALNVAQAAARAGAATALVGWVGSDADGAFLHRSLIERQIADWLITVEGGATGRYVAMEEPSGEMSVAVADLDIPIAAGQSAFLDRLNAAADAAWWFADTNLDEDGLRRLAAHPGRPPLALDAVSGPKAGRLLPLLAAVDLLFCNSDEVKVLFDARPDARGDLARLGPKAIVVTDGAAPVTVFDGSAEHRLDSVADNSQAVSATGRGDRLAGTTLAHLIAGDQLAGAVARGIDAAGRAYPEESFPVQSGPVHAE